MDMKQLSNAVGGFMSRPSTSKLEKLLDERIGLAEAMKLATMIVGTYPNADKVGDTYLGAVAAILQQYPASVARQAAALKNGVMRYTRFLPTVADLVSYCEGFTEPLRKQVDYDARTKRQLADRDVFVQSQTVDRQKHLSITELKQKYGDWQDDWRPLGELQARLRQEAKAKLIAEFGQETFDAIPNAIGAAP